jgi:hypothetical protein
MPEGEGPRFERARRGFPIGIAIIREGTYGPPISSRNVYADELTPEELADRERQGLGYPQAVEIERLTRPTSVPVESPSADQIAAPNEPSDQADPLVETGRAETELLAPSGDSVHVRHAAGPFTSRSPLSHLRPSRARRNRGRLRSLAQPGADRQDLPNCRPLLHLPSRSLHRTLRAPQARSRSRPRKHSRECRALPHRIR